ncbi:hypothetical protein ACFLQV_00525 [Calditrichota bacterium]
MLKRIGTLILLMAILVAIPSTSQSAPHPRKYGVELQVGGKYALLSEVNDFLISELASQPNHSVDNVNIGIQYGLGIVYRQEDHFGWTIGHNRFREINKYRAAAVVFGGEESWSEQTVLGSETYALANWYMDKWGGELSFGIGPALYSGSLDRVNDILVAAGQHSISGFVGASGKSFGMLGTIGFEIALRNQVGLLFQAGGRLAKINELLWVDPDDPFQEEQIVYYNQTIGDKMDVDFTGGFFKVGLRMYFTPPQDWRH